ncbi:MAG: TIM barrel protein [Planctomycetaceae bacterium]
MRCGIWGACCLIIAGIFLSATFAAEPSPKGSPKGVELFRDDNLMAWCIVPFDSKKRGPEERAAMLEKLKFTKFAYDYRGEHIPTFDAEVEALKKHHVELSAWWFPTAMNDEARLILDVLKRHQVKAQLWVTGGGGPTANAEEQKARVKAEADRIRPIAEAAAQIGCKVALYNHGGWFGEPDNQIAIIEELKLPNVGIVYNQHHGHDHLANFPALLKRMMPHLYVLNLNGMNPDGERRGQKIIPLGQGELDLELLKVIRDSGYSGPIGILGHTQDDAEERLQDNLDGLKWLVKQLKGEPAGDRPKPRTPVPAPQKPAAAAPQPESTPGWLVSGHDGFRNPPLTLECRVKVSRSEAYNIFAANETKASARHWELFSMAGSGTLTAYLPGYVPDHVHSKVVVTDDKWHELAMQFEPTQVKLFVDGKEVVSQKVAAKNGAAVAGDLALGRLVEGMFDCGGDLTWVRVSSGVRAIRAPSEEVPAADGTTLGLWVLDGGKTPQIAPKGSLTNPAKRIGAVAVAVEAALPVVAVGPPVPAEFDPQVVKELLAGAIKAGDPERGAKVFSSAKFACVNCHQVGKQGGAVGPALSDAGKRLKPEEIAESFLWPKRQVKPEHMAWKVLLDDGRFLQGYKREETPEKFQLFDPATQQTQTVLKEEIEDAREVGTLMPDGLAAAMTMEQRYDVVRFLLEVGKKSGLEDLVRPEQHLAEFEYPKKPLVAAEWPLSVLPVNRDRLYDFYRKEALHFREMEQKPTMIPSFPGLDGGKLGHWGNQNEEGWRDGRWNDTDLGTLLSGVFRAPGVEVPKGVCVRLGESGEMGVCFNPETLCYEALWQGKFLKFSAVRHGFMDGVTPAGEMLPRPAGTAPTVPFVYQGFHRFGKRVAFAYRLGNVDMLDAPWVKDGKFERIVAPADTHPLKDVIAKGGSQWPQTFTTQGELGTNQPYATDTIPFPKENPWNALFFFGDHAFSPDGTAYLSTMTGDVWRVTGLDKELKEVKWKRFASGIHQGLGMVIVDGKIYVQGRDQITILHDRNQDGEADFYECFSNAMQTSTGGHDFSCGLARDKEGRFYIASGKQGLIRVSADGKQVEVLATGFRNPDGLGLCEDGSVTVPCSEGDWTPASLICLVKPQSLGSAPPHFGYPGPINKQPPALPLVYMPRGMDNSSGGQATVPDDRWGPLKGKLVHFSFGQGSHFMLLRDEVEGQPQGAIVPLVGDFRSGTHRGNFNPKDGQLYVSGMAGWGSYTPDDGCFHRVRYTGSPVQLPRGFHVHENGVLVDFTLPVDAAALGSKTGHFADSWNYRYGPGYGSPEMSPHHPGAVAHDVVEIAKVHKISETSVFVEMPEIQMVNQLHLMLQVDGGKPQELFVTVNKMDGPFTKFAGYKPVDKKRNPHPILFDMALLGKRQINPWQGAKPFAGTLEIAAGKNLTYSTRVLRAKAGTTVKLTFQNPDVVPHNWVLLKPGTLQTVGEQANKLVADPEAFIRHYVPKSDNVLAFTDIVPPLQEFVIYLPVPKEPGRYPYLCTFPGHWMVMNGELIVE